MAWGRAMVEFAGLAFQICQQSQFVNCVHDQQFPDSPEVQE